MHLCSQAFVFAAGLAVGAAFVGYLAVSGGESRESAATAENGFADFPRKNGRLALGRGGTNIAARLCALPLRPPRSHTLSLDSLCVAPLFFFC